MDEWGWMMVAAGAAGVSGLVQGATGFGFSLLLVAVLAAVGERVAGASMVANVACLFCQGTIIVRHRGRCAWRAVWPVMAGSAAGIPAGLVVLKTCGSSEWLQRGYGVFVAVVALWLVLAPRGRSVVQRPQRLLGAGAGLAGGVADGLFNTGGPPLVLYVYSRPLDLDLAKTTLQWIFLATGVYRLGLAAAQGMLSREAWVRGLAAAPVAVGGTALGLWLAARMEPGLMRRAVYVLLVLIGVKLCLT